MKTLDEIKHYFEVDLKKEVDALEAKRLVILNRYSFKLYKTILKIAGLLILTMIILRIVLPNSPLKYGTLLVPATALFAMVFPIVIWVNRASKFKSVNKECKQTLLPKLMMFIQPEMKYQPEAGIDIREFQDSVIFQGHRISKYETEDLVTLKINNVAVKLAEVRALQRSKNSNKSSSGYRSIFSGLFVRAQYPQSFSSNIIIKKDLRNSIASRAGKAFLGETFGGLVDTMTDKIDSLNLTGDRVKIDDTDFENQFTVYCKNEEYANRVLHPSIRNKMTAFAIQTQYDVQFSFTGNHLNIALGLPNLFEWDYSTTFHDFEKFKGYLFQLLFAISMVSNLVDENKST